MKEYFERINKEIADFFGDSIFHVEKDKARKCPCDLRLFEEAMYGRGEWEPEAKRTAVAAYIFHEHREVLTIAYGGVMYTRESILVGIYWGFRR